MTFVDTNQQILILFNMKRFLLTLVGMLLALPILAQDFTYEYEGQTLIYTILNEEEKTCTTKEGEDWSMEGGNNVSGNLVIPSHVLYNGNEYTVTEIGYCAFNKCTELTSVTIPESVTLIGNWAFGSCPNLKNVIISNSETSIADIAFEISVFSDNGKTLLFAPVKYDDSYTITDGVETIKSNAFHKVNFKSLSIPASVKYIEADTFAEVNIERVNFEDWQHWCETVTLENLEANPYRYGAPYAGGVKMTSYELKEGMTEIKDYVNYGLQFKDEIELPTTLKRVGAYAFYNNKELYHVFLNDSLEEIGEHAFDGCELLENQELPSTLNKIEDCAYKGCSSLTEVVLPENLSSLGANAFEECTALEKAVVVANIDYIPDYAFNKCKALTKLYLPLQLKSIGDYAFADCESMDEIKLPVSLETIGDYAFYDSNPWNGLGKITQLIIPDKVTSIGKHAFHDQSIQNLTLGKGLTTIPESAFEGVPLKSVSFSEGLQKIERNAFAAGRDCISSVILPSTVNEIEENAFENTSIQELVIPDGVLSLPSGSCGRPALLTVGKDVKTIDANAFSFENLITFRLKATMPPTLNEAFPITNEQNDQLTLVVNQGRVVSYMNNARWKQINRIIQEDWTDIEVHLDGTFSLAEEIRMQNGLMPSQVNKMKVFGPLDENDLRVIRENMVSLRSLDLSEVTNVTAIPDGQFKESLLNEIILPAGIERIGNESFANSRLLTMDALPETLTSIGDRAFEGCIRVTFSRMPESLTELGEGAFSGCSAIKEMAFTSQLSGSLPPYTFQDCTLLEHVDLSTTEIRSIGSEAFRGCYELDEIILPETLTSISYAAFYGTAIRDISFLPANVDEIGEEAFSNCRRLVAATLPQTMTSVSSNIFSGCGRLLTVSMPAGILSVGRDLVNGDKKLSNISCAATDAPEAETGAFDNIRLRYVSLTVPTLSFRTYLSAPQWGKFETILNRIPVTMDKGVEVTNVAEDEYQDMLEEDRLEELQETSTQAPQEEEQPENMRRRAARRAASRAVTNRSFAALFDGAQIQTGRDGSGTRIFINPEEGVKVTSVKLNDEEMLDKMEGNSILLPAGSNGNLEIHTDAENIETGISEVIYDEATAPIYSLTGTIVGRGRADLENLQPGIYIFCGRKIAVK